MKRKLFALALSAVMLTGSAGAAWSPVQFEGGSISGLVADEDGVLVSDVYNKIVWRIDAEGEVRRAVGQIGIPGINGEPMGKYDDGSLETALFLEPWAMAPFLDGYAITDTSCHTVRYFDETGVYTAVGSGRAGSSNGVGTGASFDTPTGLATGDNGEVYIADTGNNCIRVMTDKGEVSTYLANLSAPTGLCWHDGALYVAETGNNRILRVENRRVTDTYGINGSGSDGAYADGVLSRARFDSPQGVAVGADGAIYVADTGNGAVRKIMDGYVTTLSRASVNPVAPVLPRGLLIYDDSLLVADLFAQTVLPLPLKPEPFHDVPENAWYTSILDQATQRGLVSGTGGDFLPELTITRAQFVAMLANLHLHLNGQAVLDGIGSFDDVDEDAWYAAIVRWATGEGIINGYDEYTFGPNDFITREQIAVILRNYAMRFGHISADELKGADLSGFADVNNISSYATEALEWACGIGVISGSTDNTLQPTATASRLHTMIMVNNFCNHLMGL